LILMHNPAHDGRPAWPVEEGTYVGPCRKALSPSKKPSKHF
jgi:hypothetical protein